MKKSMFLFLTLIGFIAVLGSSCKKDTSAVIFATIDAYTVTFNPEVLNTETYAWAFGDDGTSTKANPVHTYAMVGTYTVTLTVTGKYGEGTATKEIRITKESIQTSFYGDWESGQVTGSDNHNWRGKQVVASDRISIINDGGARQGNYYARVEVRNGDNPLNCCQGTDRAEVLEMQNADNSKIYENLSSGTQRYSFSVKFDESWQTIVEHGNGAYGIFLQLHGPDNLGASPAWAFSATDNIHFNMFSGDIITSINVAHALSNGALNKGNWIDFILTVKYAKDNAGFVNIMRRDEGQTDFTEVLDISNTPTLQYSSNVNGGAVDDYYIKHGLYRNQQDFTSILYLDGFTREAAH